jgi:soluble lytic murein transglycosylase-like protein
MAGELPSRHPMRSRFIRIAAVTAALLGAAPTVAHAQLYSWRDASGNLVLSDHPRDGAAPTYAVGTTGLRTTRKGDGPRNTAYDSIIAEHASLRGVRPDLVHAVIQAESAFNPMARSLKGAMGLMQLMPSTAVQFGVTNAYDPAQNIRAGVAYLRQLLDRYSHNEELALAAYNAGPAAVEKYGAVPPYRETRDYVSRIRSRAGSAPPPTRVYRIVELKDGRETVRYTNVAGTGPQ